MQIAIVMFRSRMLTEISRHAADVERRGEDDPFLVQLHAIFLLVICNRCDR
jgi:hypothetical protein